MPLCLNQPCSALHVMGRLKHLLRSCTIRSSSHVRRESTETQKVIEERELSTGLRRPDLDQIAPTSACQQGCFGEQKRASRSTIPIARCALISSLNCTQIPRFHLFASASTCLLFAVCSCVRTKASPYESFWSSLHRGHNPQCTLTTTSNPSIHLTRCRTRCQ